MNPAERDALWGEIRAAESAIAVTAERLAVATVKLAAGLSGTAPAPAPGPAPAPTPKPRRPLAGAALNLGSLVVALAALGSALWPHTKPVPPAPAPIPAPAPAPTPAPRPVPVPVASDVARSIDGLSAAVAQGFAALAARVEPPAPAPAPSPAPTPPRPAPEPSPPPPAVFAGHLWAVLVLPDDPTPAQAALETDPVIRAAAAAADVAFRDYRASADGVASPKWQKAIARAGGPPCLIVHDDTGGKVFSRDVKVTDAADVLAVLKGVRGR